MPAFPHGVGKVKVFLVALPLPRGVQWPTVLYPHAAPSNSINTITTQGDGVDVIAWGC